MKPAMCDLRRNRNKVFAHTAFGRPRGDSEAQQKASLHCLSGGEVTCAESTGVLSFGGQMKYGNTEGESTLPMVNLQALCQMYREHVGIWWHRFADMLAPLETLTLEHVQRDKPEVIRIEVQRREG